MLPVAGRVIQLRRNCYVPFITAPPSNLAIFSACTESRNEAFRCSDGNLLTIRPSTRFRPPVQIYFNYAKDCLFLNGSEFCWEQFPNLSSPSSSELSLIQSLAIDSPRRCIDFSGQYISEHLKSLQTLTIVMCRKRQLGFQMEFPKRTELSLDDVFEMIWILRNIGESLRVNYSSRKVPRVQIGFTEQFLEGELLSCP